MTTLDDSNDFNTQFHNLEGYTLNDRKKNLFLLLNRTSKNISRENIESSLDQLHPNHYQEELFKVDALIYFRQTRKLLDILKGGNVVFVSKIIKQKWFFQEVFTDMNEKSLVDDFLPNLSYSLRMKVLNRLSVSLSEAQMDKLFDCLLKRYGLFIAVRFLLACSVAKIETTLRANEFKLSPSQLKILFNKSPQLLILYLTLKNDIYDNDKLFLYIAQKNPALYWELREKFKIRTSLGRRTTKKMIELKKNDIISNVEEYISILKKGVVVRRLKGEFPKMYRQIFPSSLNEARINNIRELHLRLLKLYPKKRRWDMFSETFENVYGISIYENLNILRESFITTFCEKGVQRKWAEVKYKETENNDFLKYYETKESIPLIKQKINLTSKIPERNTLLQLLIASCAQNDDMICLEEVLKYFCFRHRNEDYNVRSGFLRTISRYLKLENLNENHWKYINEQIELMRVKDEFSYYQHSDIVQKHLIFLYKNKKPTEEATIQYIKDIIKADISSFSITTEDVSLKKEILISIINLLPQVQNNKECEGYIIFRDVDDFNNSNKSGKIYLSDYAFFEKVGKSVFAKSENFNSRDCCIIRDVLLYNWDCPEKRILVYNDQKLLQIVSYIYRKDTSYHYTLDDALSIIVCRPNREKIENDLLALYFNTIIGLRNIASIVQYFINNEPQVIVQYYNTVLQSLKKNEIIDFKLIKKYSHLDLDKKTITFFKNEVPTKAEEPLFIEGFSILMTTDDYLMVIEHKYLPKKDKLDLNDKKENELYTLQCHAVKMIKNVQEPYKAFTVLLKFCVGDYLQPSVPTLYKMCYLTPEKLLLPHIETLSKRAVAVRKHALFLACELLEQEKAINMFKVLAAVEKNISSQKHYISAALKYFQKNPSDEVFNLFISNMNSIDKNDKEFLETLTDIVKIPTNYKPLYVQKTWELFENLGNEDTNIYNYLKSLLQALDKNIIPNMDLEFCKSIIKKYFLMDKLNNINYFIYNFIAVHDQQKDNLDLVFKIITDFKKENFVDRKSATKMNQVFSFFTTFFENVRDNEEDKILLLNFKQLWEQVFNLKESFEQIVSLNLLKLFNENNRLYSDQFVTTVGDYFEQLVTEFGKLVTYLFVTPFNNFFENNKDKFYVILGMLKLKSNAEVRILALEIIKSGSKHEKDVTNEILDEVAKCDFEIVQTLYNQFITSTSCC